jgi:hypothetical protein
MTREDQFARCTVQKGRSIAHRFFKSVGAATAYQRAAFCGRRPVDAVLGAAKLNAVEYVHAREQQGLCGEYPFTVCLFCGACVRVTKFSVKLVFDLC